MTQLVQGEVPAEAGSGGVSQHVQAAEGLRAAARWLVAALAAVGGVLVAQIPTTSLGSVARGSWWFYVAIAAITISLCSIAYMIWQVSRVFTAPYISLGALLAGDFSEAMRKPRLMHHESSLFEVTQAIAASSNELFAARAATLAELGKNLRRVNEKARSDPSSVELQKAADLQAVATRVVDFANYDVTRRTFRQLLPRIAIAGGLAAVGVMIYAYSLAADPEKEVDVTEPTQVIVTLDPDAENWEELLGGSCDLSDVSAVAVGGTLREPEIVTTGIDGCRVQRLTLEAADGVAVPVLAPPE